MRVPAVIVAAVIAAAGVWSTTAAAHKKRDLGREVLAANDGWASLGTGTTGGSAALDINR
jgi:pectate lyase